MNHNEFKKLLQLSLFGELSKEEQNLLEEHLQNCSECIDEFESQKNLLQLVSSKKQLDADESLLSEARAQLHGALHYEKQNKNVLNNLKKVLAGFSLTPARLALSGAALFIIGLFVGSMFFTGNNAPFNVTNSTNEKTAVLTEGVSISNIQFIDTDPSDGEVEFTFQAVKPVHMKGKVSDPKIQSILTYAMLNERNPGSRLNSISAMDVQKKLTVDSDIRDALITVVMTDDNPGVRREALTLLKKFPYEESLKQAYLYVLANDSVSGMRIEALNALIDASKSGLSLSESELELFQAKIQNEDNNYIKFRARTILQEYK